MAEATLDDRLQALVGRPISDGGTTHGPDPVNQPMIRHWAAAFEDENPVYTDPDAAARSRFGEIVAPPLMLQTWTMATPRITGMAERGGSPVEGVAAAVLDLLDEEGFVGTLASNSEFEIVRYLRLGDVVSATHGARIGVAGEADADRSRPLRHVGDDVHATRPARSSAARRSASSSSGRTEHRRELPARAVDDGRHAVLLGRRARRAGC